MAWIQSHTVLLRHRKLIELAKDLRLRPVYALGHLHALWHAALEQQEDGDLSSWSDEFISNSSDYTGQAPQYVQLLQKHKWLDGKRLHDWLQYAGRYLETKYRTGDVPRLQEIWSRHGESYEDTDRRTAERRKPKSDCSPTLVRPDKSRLDQMINTTAPPKPAPGEDAPKPYTITGPGQQVVAAYKILRDVKLEDRGWDELYYPRFKKQAELLLKFFGGDVEQACRCMEGIKKWAEHRRPTALDWTLDTVVSRASDWKQRRLDK